MQINPAVNLNNNVSFGGSRVHVNFPSNFNPEKFVTENILSKTTQPIELQQKADYFLKEITREFKHSKLSPERKGLFRQLQEKLMELLPKSEA